MTLHKPKVFRYDKYFVSPLTKDLDCYHEEIHQGYYDIFSINEVCKYNMNRKINSLDESARHLNSVSLNYRLQTSFTYFILDTKEKKLVGVVNLLAPNYVKFLYSVVPEFISSFEIDTSNLWGIEFYLNPIYTGKGIMGFAVYNLTDILFDQGASSICAIVLPENIKSVNLLTNNHFYNLPFKDKIGQTLYVKECE